MTDRNLADCVPELQKKVPLLIEDYNSMFPGRQLKSICTLRSTQEQQNLFAVGRTIPPYGPKYYLTKVDGVIKFSKHNPDPIEPLSKAVDFGVFIGGKYLKHDIFYYPLLDLARKYELVSGLYFFQRGLPLEVLLQLPEFRDSPHIETKGPLYSPPHG